MRATEWLKLATLSLLWGGSFFFVALIVPHLPPMTIVLIRVGLGALVLALLLAALGTSYPRGGAVWRMLFVMALVNNVIPFTLFVLAQSQIASGLAAILNATTPLFSALVAHAATRDERLSAHKAAGILIGFAGVVLMIGVEGLDGTWWAQLACLGAALSYGVASVWGRRFKAMGLKPLSGALGQMTASTVILLPLVLLLEQPWSLPLPPPHALAALIALATVSTALAYGLYFGLIASAGAVNASLVTLLIPVSAVGLGVAFLGETLTGAEVLGMAVILLGLVILDGRLVARLVARPRR